MRNPLSRKIVEIQPSGIRKFFDVANEMEDAISLGVGEPDFDTPWRIREEGMFSLEKGRTFYTSNAGLKELRKEICNYLERKIHVKYDAVHETLVTVGGSEAIDVGLRCMLDPGDEVLIPQPSYVSYLPCTVMADGVPVIIPLQEKGQGTVRSPRLAAKRLNHDFASKFATNRDRHLGAMYNNPEWMTDAPEFEDTNFMLSALNAYGVLEDDSTKRWAKAFLIAPAIRVIFELSLLALDKSCDEIHLPNIGVSAKHKENVSYVHRLFKNNKFQDYLQAGRIVFDTYQEAHSVIENTDFGESVEYSSLGSHKSMKDYDIDTIMRLSNDAVLFAMLCQQYVQFKKQGV